MQQGVADPVATAHRLARAKQSWAADGNEAFSHEPHAIRSGPNSGPGVNRGIELRPFEQERARLRSEIHRYVGMRFVKHRQAGQKPFRGERRHHREFERCALPAFRHEFQRIAFEIVQARDDFSAIRRAGFRQRHAAAASAKQLDAQECFQGADLAAYRALRHGKLVRRFGEALVASGRFEGAERTCGRNFPAHEGWSP
jgi:hypothetical protein